MNKREVILDSLKKYDVGGILIKVTYNSWGTKLHFTGSIFTYGGDVYITCYNKKLEKHFTHNLSMLDYDVIKTLKVISVTRVYQDKYNTSKLWVERYYKSNRSYHYNQIIRGASSGGIKLIPQKFASQFARISKLELCNYCELVDLKTMYDLFPYIVQGGSKTY